MRQRFERILGHAAIATSVLSLVAALSSFAADPPARPPAVAGAPHPVRVLFDSITVDHPQFSPNGDGKLDSIQVVYVLTRSTTVTIAVTPAGADLPRRELVTNMLQPANIRMRFSWNGKIDNAVVTDGDYRLRLSGVTVQDSLVVENERIVRVDTASPVPQILAIEPPIFTPGVDSTPGALRVRIRVTGAELGDALKATLQAPRPLALRLVGTFIGDGDYVAACDSCATPRTRVPDGIYDVQATASDPAGNELQVASPVDKDILGPAMRLVHPSSAAEIYLQHADSLSGAAWDRHGVAHVELEIKSGADTLLQALPGSTVGRDTLYFTTDVAAALAREARYELRFFGRDPYGVVDTLERVVVVDRTPPPQPLLSPRPAPVSKLEQLDLVVAVDSAATSKLLRTGGAAAPESITVRGPRVPVAVLLRPGVNHLRFEGIDRAHNVSAAETVTVRWETAIGPSIPERFRAGNEIQIAAGSTPGRGVEVRLYATDGTLVQRFESNQSLYVYSFKWNLQNPSGRRVRNGAYLVQVLLRAGDGRTERWRKLIAVLD